MRKRNPTIDLARLFAAYGVIALHIPSGTFAADILNKIFWPICVPFFYFTSLIYFIQGMKMSGKSYYIRNWRRIILPYIIWTIIYLSLLAIKHRIAGDGGKINWWRAIFYGESAVHLYFIPTLLFMQAVAMGIYLFFAGERKDRIFAFITLIFSALYFIVGVMYECYGIRTVGSLCGILIFISAAFIASSWTDSEISEKRVLFCSIGSIILLSALICNFSGQLLMVWNYPLIFPLGGIGFFLIAVSTPFYSIPKRFLQLTTFSYGIYLCHIVFLEAYEVILDKIFHYQAVNDLTIKLFETTFIFSVSLIFILIAKSFSFLSVALGDK